LIGFRIQKREVLEEANDLEPRVSVLGECTDPPTSSGEILFIEKTFGVCLFFFAASKENMSP
jgi:hypothetical protein